MDNNMSDYELKKSYDEIRRMSNDFGQRRRGPIINRYKLSEEEESFGIWDKIKEFFKC